MNKKTQILTVILVLQVILSAWILNKANPIAKYEKKETLLSFESNAIDSIKIHDDESKTVQLTKTNNSWIAPQKDNFPVSEKKVEKFIKQLSSLKRAWYAGKTQIAAKQFAVTDDKFE